MQSCYCKNYGVRHVRLVSTLWPEGTVEFQPIVIIQSINQSILYLFKQVNNCKIVGDNIVSAARGKCGPAI